MAPVKGWHNMRVMEPALESHPGPMLSSMLLTESVWTHGRHTPPALSSPRCGTVTPSRTAQWTLERISHFVLPTHPVTTIVILSLQLWTLRHREPQVQWRVFLGCNRRSRSSALSCSINQCQTREQHGVDGNQDTAPCEASFEDSVTIFRSQDVCCMRKSQP